ncbi:MAG: hypothetical protein ACREJQ_02230, partial [bacterium]
MSSTSQNSEPEAPEQRITPRPRFGLRTAWLALWAVLVAGSGYGLLLLTAPETPGPPPVLGAIQFTATGTPQAHDHFVRGVLWMHNFEYGGARDEFVKARTLDPEFVLAYWGEALSYNQPVWDSQDAYAGREALRRLASTPEQRQAKARTDRERLYLAAAEALYAPGVKRERDTKFADAMRRVHAAYPDDDEATVFYALAILGTVHEEKGTEKYERAAALLEPVFKRNYEHPGAAHYLLHAYDHPDRAERGLPAARAYAKIAPASVHALHMPSHIFMALGLWAEAAKSNEAALAAANAKRHDAFHELHWETYAYLQQGRFKEALKNLETFRAAAKNAGPSLRVLFFAVRNAYLIETRRWDSEVAMWPVDLSGIRNPAIQAGDLYVRSLVALNTGRVAEADAAVTQLKAYRESAYKMLDEDDSEAPWYEQVSEATVLDLDIEALKLEGQVRIKQGEVEAGLALLDKAATLEDRMAEEYGPPGMSQSAHEAAGEVLLALGRTKAARHSFERALILTPRRSRARLGAWKAPIATDDIGA